MSKLYVYVSYFATWLKIVYNLKVFISMSLNPPVDLHWFFGISIRTEKKIQLELRKKNQLVYTTDYGHPMNV